MSNFYVKCSIYKGVFSGEYSYNIKLKDGRIYSSIAPTHYFLNESKKPIDNLNSEINGFVKCYPVEKNQFGVKVQIPTIQQFTSVYVDDSIIYEL